MCDSPPPSAPRTALRTVHHVSSTPSTNLLALAGGGDGEVFVAETQTMGRGRLGNVWESAPGLGLWFSVRLEGPMRGVGFGAALAVRDAVAPRAVLKVKWPNDLLCNGRKVCGILVEQRSGWTALGVGLNVSHKPADFPAALRGRAGSLESETGLAWDRAALLERLLDRMDAVVLRLRAGEYESVRTEWAAACDMVGSRIRRGGLSGRVQAVDGDGALLVETGGGLVRVTGGEMEPAAPDGAATRE